MKSITRFFIALFITLSASSNIVNAQEMQKSNTSCFIQNNGQIADSKGRIHPEVLFKSSFNDVTMFFKNNGIVYLFNRYDKVPTEESINARSKGDITRANVLETKPMMFRMDLQFLNTNPDVTVIPSGKHKEVSNYYLAHCPQGILNVNSFDNITYKNLYKNIDLVYYYTVNGLKYDLVVNPGGNISDIKFKYEGANQVYLSDDGQLNIIFADGQKLIEEKPIAFFENEKGISQDIQFSLDKTLGIIGVSSSENTFQKTLIIDPVVSWATYFHNTNSANSSWTNTEYDANGNFFMADQTYDNSFPLANPGGGAYYDATMTTMIKVVVLKFNVNRTLIWSTYYGGDDYSCLAGCTDYGKALALDNTGNVYIAGYTDVSTTIFPTYNPGGGAFYQDQTKIYSETSFFLKFNNNGVRQWATMFQHEQANTSSNGIRLNGITCDGTYLYFTGQCYDWDLANTVPLRNPGGGAYYQPTLIGDQDVFVGRFNSTQGLNWCTYLNSGNIANTAYGQGLDLHCDTLGNLFFVGRESGVNNHHLITNLAGAYNQSTNNGSNLIITKFNTSLQVLWSTYYGGNGMDIPSTIEPDRAGNIYMVGRVTQSTNFPTYDPGGGALYQSVLSNAASDGFLIKFNASTCARTWATYLGATVPLAASDENHFYGLAFNTSNDHVFVMGDTPSNTITTINKAGSYNQAVKGGGFDMFFYEFDNAGVPQWASYYGGTGNEQFYNGRIGYQQSGCGLMMVTHVGTGTQNIPTVDPGNGAWYQSSTSFLSNDFILELSDESSIFPVDVSIVASDNFICAGTSVTFTATPINGGTPSYQWYLNGNPVGFDSTNYTNSSLVAGDQIYCIMTSSITCTSNNPATSNTIIMTVNTNSVAPTSISASANPICPGNSTTLTVNGGSLGTGASWQWYSGSCGGTPAGTGTSISVSPSVNTTYFVLAQGTCDTTICASLLVTVNIVIAEAGNDQDICLGNSTTLTASGGETYLWSESSQTTASIDVSPTTATTYFVTVSDGIGCTDIDSVTVSVNLLPVADAGTDTTICNGSNTQLNASGGGTYLWSPSAGLSATDISNPIANPTSTTTYTVTVTNTNNCSAIDSVVVTVNSLPTADAGTDVAICNGDSSQLNAGGGGTYLWSPSSGLSATNISNPMANPTTTTTYTVIVTNTNNCSATDNVVVTVNSLPIANAGTDVDICNGDSTQLSASGGTSYSWSPSSGLSASDVSNPYANPATTTTYTVTVTNANNCSAIDNVVVTVNSLPTASAGTDTVICNGENIQLLANGGATYSWSPSTGLSATNISNPLANPTTTTTYTVIVTNSNNCSATDNVLVTVNPTPTANAGIDVSICYGDSTQLSASGGTSYSWSPSSGLSATDISNPYASPTTTTTYTLTVTNAFNCEATDNVTVTIIPTPVVSITSEPLDFAYVGQIVTFIASPPAYDNYDFYLNNNLVQSGSSNIYQTSSLQGSNTVTVFIGCGDEPDSVLIDIHPIPNAFTPYDLNGKNDVFVKGLDLTIFNRWDQELYKGTDGWDGKYNGNLVSPGTYFYIIKLIDINNITTELKGTVTVIGYNY